MILRAFSRNYTIAAMSSSTVVKSSPFTQAVISAVRKLYPEELADKSFDNTGVLLEAPHRKSHNKNSVLLTIDLTKAVADEAIARRDSVIISYHPIIFRPLKALTLANSQQTTLLRLAQEGISVYSPHTAVDAAPDGLGTWLADIITEPLSDGNPKASTLAHERLIITPVTGASGLEGAGYGRIVKFHSPQSLGLLIKRINAGLGSLTGLSVAVPQSVPAGSKFDLKISSVGICAGSGESILSGLDVDLLFTGELNHHTALAAIEQGKVVITAFHSNTERAFLKQKMAPALYRKTLQEIDTLMIEGTEEMKSEVDINVSKMDRDPFDIVTKDQLSW